MNPIFRKISLKITQNPRFAAKLMKVGMNLFPPIRRTGGRIDYVAPDMREVRIRLPLNWSTRNIMGSIFGGSMFSITDPIYMTLLYFNLGNDYVVWDKGASIRFRKPGKTTLYGTFKVTETELAEIREQLKHTHSIDKIYPVQLIDRKGVVHAELERVIYIGNKAKLRERDLARADASQNS